jgi:UPF0271 protein
MGTVFTPVGERALRFELPAQIDRRALLDYLRALHGVADASLAAEHALVVFREEPRELAIPEALPARGGAPATHEIRVAYDGADLGDVARSIDVDVDALIALHTGRAHEVRFLGFCPGFAYLGPVDARLARVTRRASPRARVQAGSVALAGGYTGVYPADTPGGWQLLGRAIDFDAFRGDHTRFEVGDLVRFVRA